MDSDHLFGIFKLFLHIKHKDFPAQAYVILARFDCPDLTLVTLAKFDYPD